MAGSGDATPDIAVAVSSVRADVHLTGGLYSSKRHLDKGAADKDRSPAQRVGSQVAQRQCHFHCAVSSHQERSECLGHTGLRGAYLQVNAVRSAARLRSGSLGTATKHGSSWPRYAIP